MITQEYLIKLKKGCEYQDFVSDILYKNGLPIRNYTSQKYQLSGENKAGIEIKFDGKMAITKNIYIETAEKSNKNNAVYVKSGIYRNDNSWLYLIGDYSTIYFFSKKQLVVTDQENKYKKITTETSKGFLIPIFNADKFLAIKILKL